MMPHEYSVVGHSRSQIGRWLYVGAAGAASLLTTAGLAAGQALAQTGWPTWLQLSVVAPVSAATVFGGVHWAFGKFGWRALCWFSKVPNISGSWDCRGETRDEQGNVTRNWNATVTITQDWEKLKVGLRTAQSGSYSVTAALIPEGDGCWLLMYSYRNEPRAGEAELNPHVGYCEMRFASSMSQAEGDYFNARGRGTFGRMTFTRTASHGR